MNKLLVKYEEESMKQALKDFQDVVDEILDYKFLDADILEMVESVYFKGYSMGKKKILEVIKDFN